MQACHCPPPATPTPCLEMYGAPGVLLGVLVTRISVLLTFASLFSVLPAASPPCPSLPTCFPAPAPASPRLPPRPPPEPLATTRLTLQPLPLPPRPTGSLFPLHSLPFPLHSSHLFLPRGPVPSSPGSAIHVTLSTALHITTILFSNEDYYFFFFLTSATSHRFLPSLFRLAGRRLGCDRCQNFSFQAEVLRRRRGVVKWSSPRACLPPPVGVQDAGGCCVFFTHNDGRAFLYITAYYRSTSLGDTPRTALEVTYKSQ